MMSAVCRRGVRARIYTHIYVHIYTARGGGYVLKIKKKNKKRLDPYRCTHTNHTTRHTHTHIRDIVKNNTIHFFFFFYFVS